MTEGGVQKITAPVQNHHCEQKQMKTQNRAARNCSNSFMKLLLRNLPLHEYNLDC